MSNALVHVSDYQEVSAYLADIEKYPFLTQTEEYDLAVRYWENQDRDAAHTLVTSYLRYVVKIAREYNGYGLKMMDLIQEGSIGLMRAVKKFDPYKGFRLATYAMWWIRASIQEYVLRSWSLVKIATTTAQRKLFFNLRKSKETIDRLDQSEAQVIGERLGVSTELVLEMDGRLSGPDDSLNRQAIEGGDEIQDLLTDNKADQEATMLSHESTYLRKEMITQALSQLNEREQIIIQRRIMTDKATTLEALGQEMGVSRERIRQLEKRALQKLQEALKGSMH
ncbi:MAG: RNA polymerase sigma factor RpoH [Magnetococcales bacterium]|nr:RNA polymerase sigma factor RpoH [Magnetococcales bacterium]